MVFGHLYYDQTERKMVFIQMYYDQTERKMCFIQMYYEQTVSKMVFIQIFEHQNMNEIINGYMPKTKRGAKLYTSKARNFPSLAIGNREEQTLLISLSSLKLYVQSDLRGS